VRGGGKDNRKTQVSRIIEFLDWVESTEKVYSLHGIGKKHVIGFWKSHRHLSEDTAYKYWLGICKLWEWIGKHEAPPKPFKISAENLAETVANNNPVFSEFSKAIKAARKSKKLTVQQLANMTGCEVFLIKEVESGKELDILYKDIKVILEALDIKFICKSIDSM
jgi:hypothetical protein